MDTSVMIQFQSYIGCAWFQCLCELASDDSPDGVRQFDTMLSLIRQTTAVDNSDLRKLCRCSVPRGNGGNGSTPKLPPASTVPVDCLEELHKYICNETAKLGVDIAQTAITIARATGRLPPAVEKYVGVVELFLEAWEEFCEQPRGGKTETTMRALCQGWTLIRAGNIDSTTGDAAGLMSGLNAALNKLFSAETRAALDKCCAAFGPLAEVESPTPSRAASGTISQAMAAGLNFRPSGTLVARMNSLVTRRLR